MKDTFVGDYWMDMNTGNVYEIDTDTSVGMSFLNDKAYNFTQISKEKYNEILAKSCDYVIQLQKQEKIFIVKTYYSDDYLQKYNTYRFNTLGQASQFINGDETFDVYGDRRVVEYHEQIVDIYERTNYEINWR